MYVAGNKANQAHFTKIQWISELTKAAKLQQHHEEAQSELKALEAQLEAARKLAYSLLPTVEAELGELSDVTQVENKATNTGKKEAQSKCSDGKNKSAEECQTLGCDHDTENNKCKPKTGTESTAAGTGQAPKEGAATSGRAKHQNQPDCEKDKTDDKQNCAWRKGKEGEDDKDTEKYRSSSFLPSKTSALMVHAAFVALLF
ncbi:Trypanosome variant surface glycoprotein C-terminal domain containing protein, putative [Trypanosoma equiperdum]|uniref:Trypanosome variant surface glycoprotein C-terminal domain containing protein, putative n=1 Tax=Trypanosoma equiperdum TaxID=5694 RepID=A0A1G4IJB6_TRYEQ|nr:Trypanosome variant surface glycoprotein C-terminal domain containing protein, putative [Trypanosoma equiperdum]